MLATSNIKSFQYVGGRKLNKYMVLPVILDVVQISKPDI